MFVVEFEKPILDAEEVGRLFDDRSITEGWFRECVESRVSRLLIEKKFLDTPSKWIQYDLFRRRRRLSSHCGVVDRRTLLRFIHNNIHNVRL